MNTPISGNFKLYIEGLIEEKRSIGYPYELICSDIEGL